MGKKKIEIEYIPHKQTRMVTFTKRRNGLFKKAEKFSKLSGSSIAILVFSEGNKIYPSDSSPSFEATLDRFLSKTTSVVSNKDSCDFTFDGCRDLDKIISGSTSTSPGSSTTNAGSFNDSTEALLLELDDLPDFKLDLSDELDVYLKLFNSMPGTPNNSPGLSSTDAGSFLDSMKVLLNFNVDGCEDLEELLVFKSSLEQALRERRIADMMKDKNHCSLFSVSC